MCMVCVYCVDDSVCVFFGVTNWSGDGQLRGRRRACDKPNRQTCVMCDSVL